MTGSRKYKIIRMTASALFFAVAIAAFSGCGVTAAYAMHIEFLPAVAAWISGASVWSMVIVLLHVIFARFAGRVYCSILCPLGIMQDITGLVPFAKNTPSKGSPAVRYLIAGAAAGMLFGATTAGFFFLDPYSLFGRSVSAFLFGGTLPVAIILLLTLFKRRFFCNYICPAGTTLGLMAKNGVFQLHITENCVNCKKCVKVCPAGCIAPEKHSLDNERCLRCMECVSACPVQAVKFIRKKEQPSADRRTFLINAGIGAAGFAAGYVLSKFKWSKLLKTTQENSGIYPPGAAKAELFDRKCTGCLLCTKVCPSKIIVPARNGIGPVSLDLEHGSCLYDCTRCGDICPTGAIRKLPRGVKQKLKIAQAKFDPSICLVYQEGAKCGKCSRACPAGAVTLKRGAPRFKPALCIGCGACQQVCPTEAFSIEKIKEQIPLEQE